MEKNLKTVTISFRGSNLRGIKLNSINGLEYYGFLGIPYAKPPVEDLRFLPPQPIESYPKDIDATCRGNLCLQKRYFTGPNKERIDGSEDCLYLNVFIPKLPKEDQKLQCTMIHVSGGAYIRTSLLNEDPDGLIEHDIIFVSVTYRLHILGFLNLGLPECPGNVGLKDLVEAIKWVKRNIHEFGGDPNNITLCGTSSGGSSVHFLTLSPLTKGLFNKVIISDGDASSLWGLVDNPVDYAFKIGRVLGFDGTSRRKLLTFLKSLPPEDLLDGVFKIKIPECMTKSDLLWSLYMFRPSIEFIKEGALLPDSPRELWKNVNSISILNGICEYDGSFFFHNKYSLDEYFDRNYVKNLMKIFVEDYVKADREKRSLIFQEIEKFYFGDEENTTESIFTTFLKFCTDLSMREYYTVFNFMKKPEINSTFNYLFCCRTALNHSQRLAFPLSGTFHADEYYYVMTKKNSQLNIDEEAMYFSWIVRSLWTNFAKTGNPNGNQIDVYWKSASIERPCYLRIDKNTRMVSEDINKDRVKFWKYLYDKFSL